MDWKLFAQLAATFLVAVFAGWLGHYLASRRDLMNEKRKLRIPYLVEAYRKLGNASNRDVDKEAWALIESVITDIQLLGSVRQAELAYQLALDVAEKGTASLDDLLFDLRQSLRHELGLEPIDAKFFSMRLRR